MLNSLEITEKELLSLKKPAQYLGEEKNAVIKNESEVSIHFGLAFPDLYEVGMSHVGIQILYHLINLDPNAWAERIYMPMPDMEKLLKTKDKPLFSIESRRPLSEFDVVGFSLQYELCATNILAMLDISNIPIYAKDRNENYPLIIAGGPYSYHPEALSSFFDLFFLGDAEEFIPEFLESLKKCKSRNLSRTETLNVLRDLEGVYIPSDFEHVFDDEKNLIEIRPLTSKSKITRRLLPTMENAPFPINPIIPNSEVVHNRLSVEVMRGCVRGCRFCQAGYLYRPQRERSPSQIKQIIKDALGQTGYEEVSLLSLSTADYCSIVPLLKSLMDEYGEGDKVSISFPSTRVDSLKNEILEQVQRVRRTSFTIAPEGGTQRLRDVINKGVSDEQIIETCTNVFKMGWTGIKLYFMLGLPTETDQDLMGIIDIATRLRKIPDARGKEITVSVSTHVPKPHTPFQWAAQITPEETIRKQRLLADGLRSARVNFRYHNHFSSLLEGIFCRAGREFTETIVRAYELGCRLDAWNEYLNEELWMQACYETNIDPFYYLRERSIDEVLPWDHLSCGIPKSYFQKEWKRALRDRVTADCLTSSCSVCEACDYDKRKNILWPRDEAEIELEKYTIKNITASSSTKFRYRGNYMKKGSFRFLGHLEIARIIQRAARRAKIPVSYSLGFHPHPKFSFGPPLQTGVSSNCDYFDVWIEEKLSCIEIIEKFNSMLPLDLQIQDLTIIDDKEKSLQESIKLNRYSVSWLNEPSGLIAKQINKLNCNTFSKSEFEEEFSKITISREPKENSKKNKKLKVVTFNVSEFIENYDFIKTASSDNYTLNLDIKFDHTRACPNALEIVNALSQSQIGDYTIEKTESVFKFDACEI